MNRGQVLGPEDSRLTDELIREYIARREHARALSPEVIADKMGIARSSVYSRMQRILSTQQE